MLERLNKFGFMILAAGMLWAAPSEAHSPKGKHPHYKHGVSHKSHHNRPPSWNTQYHNSYHHSHYRWKWVWRWEYRWRTYYSYWGEPIRRKVRVKRRVRQKVWYTHAHH